MVVGNLRNTQSNKLLDTEGGLPSGREKGLTVRFRQGRCVRIVGDYEMHTRAADGAQEIEGSTIQRDWSRRV